MNNNLHNSTQKLVLSDSLADLFIVDLCFVLYLISVSSNIYTYSSRFVKKGPVSDKSTKIYILIVHYIPKHISYGPNLNLHFF